MEVKELAKELNEKLDSIKTNVEEKAAKTELTALQTTITELSEKGATKEDLNAEFKKLEEILEKQGEQITKLGRKNVNNALDRKTAIKEALPRMQEVYKSGAGMVDLFEQKAVALVTTSTAATTNTFGSQALINVNEADESNAGNILQGTWIETYATVSRINRAYYSYVDWKPLLGGATAVTEGAAKPQMDFYSVATQVAPSKVAAYIALTEESVTDIDELNSVANEMLLKNVMLKRQDIIRAYVQTNANSFTAGGSLSGKVSNPNLFDVIKAISTQIYMTENYTDEPKATPNLAFVNPYDFAEFQLAKNSDGSYVLPEFAMMDGVLAGVKIVPNPDITAGQVLVGDFTKLNIKNYIDYSVRLGWTGTQFIENEFTMVGETRYFAFIKSLDTKAFVYDAIATVQSDINKT